MFKRNYKGMHVVGTKGTVFEEYCKGFLKEKRDWNYILKVYNN